MEEVKNNLKLFRRIVREHNAKTGFSFVLPKDTDYTYQYAHPVHDDGVIKITSQIDDSNELVYGIRLQLNSTYVCISDDTTKEKLDSIMQTETFKYRVGVVKELDKLKYELDNLIHINQSQIFSDVLNDLEREDNYDTAIRAAKALYKGDN